MAGPTDLPVAEERPNYYCENCDEMIVEEEIAWLHVEMGHRVRPYIRIKG